MRNPLAAELASAAIATFEQLAFLPAEVLEDPDEPDGQVTASCRVRFRGPASGALEMEVAGDFLGELAANMLGLEGEPGETERRDALGEITNVICGNVLPHLGGPTAVFDLSPPEVFPHPLPPCARPDGRLASLALAVGGGRAAIRLRVYG